METNLKYDRVFLLIKNFNLNNPIKVKINYTEFELYKDTLIQLKILYLKQNDLHINNIKYIKVNKNIRDTLISLVTGYFKKQIRLIKDINHLKQKINSRYKKKDLLKLTLNRLIKELREYQDLGNLNFILANNH